jgi:hypothetical protein
MASTLIILIPIILALVGWYWMRGFKIIYAVYGRNREKVRITRRLNALIKRGRLDVVLDNCIPGSDPAPHITKIGTVIFRYNGRLYKRQFLEGESIDLP